MGRRRNVIARIKLQLEAGGATPAPPVGRDLGPHGVNLAEFCKQYNDATKDRAGAVIPAEVTVYEDRSFSFLTKTPLTSYMIRTAASIERGASSPNGDPAGEISQQQLRSIAETKLPDLNAGSIEAAMRVVEGTARSMGVRVRG